MNFSIEVPLDSLTELEIKTGFKYNATCVAEVTGDAGGGLADVGAGIAEHRLDAGAEAGMADGIESGDGGLPDRRRRMGEEFEQTIERTAIADSRQRASGEDGEGFIGSAALRRSADFQSAVSPISNRQGVDR